MNDFLKKGFLLGLGAAISSKEKLEENISRLVQKGMMTRTEADSLFNDFLKKGEEKSEGWNQEFRNTIKNQLKDLGFVTREELDTVQAQLALLKEDINKLRNTDSFSGTNDHSNNESPRVSIEKNETDLY